MFNSVDATYRSDLREVNELNFARFDAKLEHGSATEKRSREMDVRLWAPTASRSSRVTPQIVRPSPANPGVGRKHWPGRPCPLHLGILIATLHSRAPSSRRLSFTSLRRGALAELIENLLLFIPSAPRRARGVRPLPAIAIGLVSRSASSFCNSGSPAAIPAPRHHHQHTSTPSASRSSCSPTLAGVPPRRAAWQALANAALAALVWIGTGAVLRPIVPDPPYHDILTPEWDQWARMEESARLERRHQRPQSELYNPATVVAADRPRGASHHSSRSWTATIPKS